MSYSQLKIKKAKRDLKEKADTSIDTSSFLIDPELVSVVGVVDRQTLEKDVQMVCRTSFLFRQRDVIASFSFRACTVHTEYI